MWDTLRHYLWTCFAVFFSVLQSQRTPKKKPKSSPLWGSIELRPIENLGGVFKPFSYFHPDPWGNDPIWRWYFSNGLVQPPTSYHKPPLDPLCGTWISCLPLWPFMDSWPFHPGSKMSTRKTIPSFPKMFHHVLLLGGWFWQLVGFGRLILVDPRWGFQVGMGFYDLVRELLTQTMAKL